MKWFEINFENALSIILSCTCIYLTVIIFTRFFGKRSFSKMSSFDFAMTVAVGSIIASTILIKTVRISEGIIGLLTVYFLQLIAAYLRKYPFFHILMDNTPLLLMDGSKILFDNLKKARVTESDLRSQLRGANVLELSQVKAVVFETTGDIIVLHTKVTNLHVEDYLLEDVAK